MRFIRFANWCLSNNRQRRTLGARSIRWRRAFPLARIPLDYSFASFIADIADKAGDWPIMQHYAAAGAKGLGPLLQESRFEGKRERVSGTV